jgi:hypothetical protein
VRDPALLAYVESIERHIQRLRGRERLLSPPDFKLAERWHRAGVPLGLIIEAIEQAFAQERELSSLALVRREVERQFSLRRARRPDQRPSHS